MAILETAAIGCVKGAVTAVVSSICPVVPVAIAAIGLATAIVVASNSSSTDKDESD
jgi:hypothetical protein